MAPFRVWAPDAREVELVTGPRSAAMTRGEGGWWCASAADSASGADYAFRVDGRGPFPDPRSPWQPRGVHGLSRRLDHGLFAWGDAGWQPPPLSSGLVYELHVGTYTPAGTFAAVIDRLDHLAGLGVSHVELMPVAEFSGPRGWGYDGVDLYAPHHAYGGPEELKRLVDACHRRGLAVILDVVYNHLGPDGNYLGFYGPYFTGRYATPWGEAMNLDGAGSDEVRRYFVDNALMWMRDYHMDGLRIDAVHAIFDMSAVHLLEQLAGETAELESRLGRRLVLVAESDLNAPRLVRSPDAGGYGLQAMWNEDFHHALHAALTGERQGYYADFGGLADVAKALTKGFVYDGKYSVYRRRRHGRPAVGLSGHHFVGFLQNHDQVGNRVEGDRMGRLVGAGLLKAGAALFLTSPFVPMLFQGEEWGAATPFLYFTGYEDPQLGHAVSEGRRREFAAFGWDQGLVPDPQAEDTFRRSKLDWTEPEREPHADLLRWHRGLVRLRREAPELTDGRLEDVRVEFDEPNRWITVSRGRIHVVCSLSEGRRLVPSPGPAESVTLLASAETALAARGGVSFTGPGVVVLGPPDYRSR